MTLSKSKKQCKSSSSSTVDLKDLHSVEKAAAEATEQHSRSANTVKRYGNVIKNAREFVAQYRNQEKLTSDSRAAQEAQAAFPEDEIIDSDDFEQDSSISNKPHPKSIPPQDNEETASSFATCLEGAPQECTPAGIVLFLWYKCFNQGCLIGTAHHIVSAFIKYYDQ
jgi:hypothetical protein